MSGTAPAAVAVGRGRSAAPLLAIDPRARLLAGLVLLPQLLMLPAGPGLWAGVAAVAGFAIAGRPPLRRLLLAFVALGWMLALTVLLHGFTTPGRLIWQLPLLDWVLTVEGLLAGLILAGRLAALAAVGVTVSLSLSALEAVRSISVLLRPLAKIGVPVGSLALMLGMTLRFVPTLYEEAVQLRRALKARGWTPGAGVLARVTAWLPLFVPLLAGALRRADDVAETLVMRGYDPGAPPGRYGFGRWRLRDTSALLLALLPAGVWAIATIA